LSWFYGLIFEVWMNGQSPGKRILDLRVVSTDGRPINAAQATIRNFLRLVEFFPFAPMAVGEPSEYAYVLPTLLVAIVAMLTTKRFQRLGDLAAGTMVIVNEPRRYPRHIQFEDKRVPSLAAAIPANFRMSASMTKTIAIYVERRAGINDRKREELAAHLSTPLLKHLRMMPDTSKDLLLCSLYYRDFLQGQANTT
jgi:hypothetical protein